MSLVVRVEKGVQVEKVAQALTFARKCFLMLM